MRPQSVLDGFFVPLQSGPALSVLRAVSALRSATAAEPDRSHGRVTSSGFLDRLRGRLIADPHGIASEITFGPLLDFACRCGRLRGRERSGQVCARCGVLCGSSSLRLVRFGHIELVGGAVHPALAPVVGAVLGLAAEEVLAVARNEAWLDGARAVRLVPDEDGDISFVEHQEATGLHILRERLARADRRRMPAELAAAGFAPVDLLVTAVPVTPPGDRPLLRPADPSIRVPQPGVINEAYRALAVRALRVERLVELDAPAIILRNEEGLMQKALEELVRASRLRDDPTAQLGSRKWKDSRGTSVPIARPAPSEPPLALDDPTHPFAGGPPDPALPCGCLWLDGERLLLQFPYAAVVASRTDGRVLLERGIFGMTVRTTDCTGPFAGQRVVFIGEHPQKTESGSLCGVAVLDTRSGGWLPTYPAELRAVTVLNDQPEDAFLYDFRSDESLQLDVPSDRPRLCALSPDHRFVWAGGDGETGLLVSTDTGTVHAEVEEPGVDLEDGPFLLEDGTVAATLGDDEEGEDEGDDEGDEDGKEEEGDEGEAAAAVAFTLTPQSRWRVLDSSGAVLDEERKLFTLAFVPQAAAFGPSGERLLAVTGTEALVIEVASPPRILQRIDLEPLRPLLVPPAAAELSEAEQDALLQRVGTLRGLGRFADSQLAALGLSQGALRTLRSASAHLPAAVRLRVTT
jgi:hypothetical protein